MKRLLLLRHAKAVPQSAAIEDHDRSLTERGHKDAPAMGKYLARKGFVPDLILCSTARRTVETAEQVTDCMAGAPPIQQVEALYLAPARELLGTLRATPDTAKTLMVVGHNPGIEQVATLLSRLSIRRKERDRFDLIEEKFPTAALAVLDFNISKWRDLAPGQGELIDFARPRDL